MAKEATYHVPVFSIETAARLTAVSVKTLREYEREGLVKPYVSLANESWYSRCDIDRLKHIRRRFTELNLNLDVVKRLYASIPCWDIVGCSTVDRSKCEAYSRKENACWTYRHTGELCQGRDCRLCEVYHLTVDFEKFRELAIGPHTTSAPK